MAGSDIATKEPADPGYWLLPSWPWTLRVVAINCLLAAEISNTLLLSGHFLEWFGSGVVFVVIAAAEGSLGVLLLLRPSRGVLIVTIAISMIILSVWLVGLPFGPDVGRPDALVGAGLEPTVPLAAAVVALIPLVANPRLGVGAARGRGLGGSAVAGAVITLLITVLMVAAHYHGSFGANRPGPSDHSVIHPH